MFLLCLHKCIARFVSDRWVFCVSWCWFVAASATDWLERLVSEMTYNVLIATLNCTYCLIDLRIWISYTRTSCILPKILYMSHRSVCNVTYLWHFCIYPSLVNCLFRNVFWAAWCRSAARKFCTWIETSTTVEKALHSLHWTRFLCSVTFCFSAFLFVCHSPVATRNRFKILHHDRRTVWRKCMWKPTTADAEWRVGQ